MALHQFSARVAPADSKITINGETIEAVGFTVQADAGGIPQVVVAVAAETDISGLAEVQVVREPTIDEMAGAAEDWVRGLDTEQLRALVKERMTTMRSDPIAITQQVIAEALAEAQDG